MQSYRFLTVLFAFALAAGTARAEDDDELKAKAREHYIAGTKLFDLGKYQEAIREYELAYQAKDDPALLYNLGQAHRLAGNTAEALRSYKTFLIKVPKAPNKAEVGAKIRELEKLQDQQRRSANMPPVGTIPPAIKPGETRPTQPRPEQPQPEAKPQPQPEAKPQPQPEAKPQPPPEPEVKRQPKPQPEHAPARPGRTKVIAGLVVAGVGVALAATGIGLGAAAIGAGNDVTSTAMMNGKFDPSREDSGLTFEAAGGALVGVGAAAAVAGVVVFVLGHLENKRAPQNLAVSPTVSKNGAGVSLSLEF
jgi:hypothetical protein